MPYEIARAIIDTAHQRQLRVAAHIFYLEDAKRLWTWQLTGWRTAFAIRAWMPH